MTPRYMGGTYRYTSEAYVPKQFTEQVLLNTSQFHIVEDRDNGLGQDEPIAL